MRLDALLVFDDSKVSIPYRFNETGHEYYVQCALYLVSIPYRFNETAHLRVILPKLTCFNSYRFNETYYQCAPPGA